MKLLLKCCPNCESLNISFYSHSGIDLYSNFITNYFIECNDCGTTLKSRNFQRILKIWNECRK